MKKLLALAIWLAPASAGAQAYSPPPSCILQPGSTACIRDLEARIAEADETIRRIDRLLQQQDADTLRFWIDDDARYRHEEQRDQDRINRALKLDRIYCYPFCKGDQR